MENFGNEKRDSKKDMFPFRLSMIVMFLSFALFILAGILVQEKYFEIGTVLIEYMIILLPVVILGKIKGVNFKKALRLNKLKGRTAFKIFILGVCLIPLVFFLNYLSAIAVMSAGVFLDNPVPVPYDPVSFVMLTMIVAVTPGICEEVMFRGMIMSAFENKTGKFYGVIFSGVLFGLFHLNPMNVLGPIILGIIFGHLVQVTNSIYSGMVAHITNNGIAVLLSLITYGSGEASKASVDTMKQLVNSPFEIIAGAITLAILALIFLFPVIFIINSIRKEYGYMPEERRLNGLSTLMPVIAFGAIYGAFMVMIFTVKEKI